MERTDARPTSPDTPRDWLKLAALVFALVATATAEYELALAVGFNRFIAATVPGALDVYVVRALRVHRDVAPAVVAMIIVNAVSHLVTARLLPVSVPIVVAVSAIAPLVLWRVHTLREAQQAAPVEDEQPQAAEPEATAEPQTDDVVAPLLHPAAHQLSPVIDLAPESSLTDAVVTAARVLGDGATSRQIAAALNAAHWPNATDSSVRAVLSRWRRDQAQQEAQQPQHGTGMYL